jgi:Family of unknown function (DUF6152)
MRFTAFGVACLFAVCLTLPVLAHHSHGNYDISTWTVMEGTVKQVIFIVPHSIVYIDVKDDKGQAATWALEATNPQGIFLRGVKKEDVQVGDTIKVRCHLPARLRHADARRQGARARRRDRMGLASRRSLNHRYKRIPGVRFLSSTDAREENLERRSPVRRALDGDEAAYVLDDLTDDCQAQA